MGQNVLELTRKAFEADQVVQLLKGEAPYMVTPDRFTPAQVPTDWGTLLREGVLPYCGQESSGTRWDRLDQAIRTLIAGNALELWCAYNVYFYLCYAAEGGAVPVPALERFPVEELHAALGRCRLQLAMTRKWSGSQLPDGLWGDIWYADMALERRYHRGVLRR